MFQPAEEGPSLYAAFTGKSWGAKAMIKEGALQHPKPNVVFGLHVVSALPSSRIGYRPGPSMASADELRIKLTGRQGHAGVPWRTVDPDGEYLDARRRARRRHRYGLYRSCPRYRARY